MFQRIGMNNQVKTPIPVGHSAHIYLRVGRQNVTVVCGPLAFLLDVSCRPIL